MSEELETAKSGLRELGFEVGDGTVGGEPMTDEEMVSFFRSVSELKEDTDQGPRRQKRD